MKPAILSNAASILIGHNHPSECQNQSRGYSLTKRLKEAGEMIRIDLLDHTIMGYDRFVSLKDKKCTSDKSSRRRYH